MLGVGLSAASATTEARDDDEADECHDGEVDCEAGEVVQDCVEVGAGVVFAGLGCVGGVVSWEEGGGEVA